MNMAAEARLLAMQETIDGLMYLIAEQDRRLANIIRPGVVKSFDAEKNTAVCDVGFETHDCPVASHAGTGKHWRPLKKGQQITLLCPSGDVANAFVLPGGFHDENKAPSKSADEDILGARGEDGKDVRHRLTDDEASLDARKHETIVRAGKEIAELDNRKGKSAVRAKKDGVVHLEVQELQKLKIKIGETFYAIRPEALIPIS